MDNYNDQHIIESIRKREDVAFKDLQVKFQDSIRLMVMEMGGSPEDAKDVFSEGLIALIRLVDQKDFELSCKLGTLVYALCKKTWKQQPGIMTGSMSPKRIPTPLSWRILSFSIPAKLAIYITF